MSQKSEPPAITVKPQGVSWTLISTNPVEWSQRPQTGHAVNIAIDPASMRLRSNNEECEITEIRSPQSHSQSIPAGRVSLRGRVKLIRHMSSACWLWIEVGTTQVSALLNEEDHRLGIWSLDLEIEIFLSGSQAWIKPHRHYINPIPCSLVYPDSKEFPEEIFGISI